MNTKPTPKNWEAIGNLVRTSLADGGYLIAECRDNSGQLHSDEAKRHARLFAASPTLLALAYEMEAFSEAAMNDAIEEGDVLGIEAWRVSMEKCRAAIAKATGA